MCVIWCVCVCLCTCETHCAIVSCHCVHPCEILTAPHHCPAPAAPPHCHGIPRSRLMMDFHQALWPATDWIYPAALQIHPAALRYTTESRAMPTLPGQIIADHQHAEDGPTRRCGSFPTAPSPRAFRIRTCRHQQRAGLIRAGLRRGAAPQHRRVRRIRRPCKEKDLPRTLRPLQQRVRASDQSRHTVNSIPHPFMHIEQRYSVPTRPCGRMQPSPYCTVHTHTVSYTSFAAAMHAWVACSMRPAFHSCPPLKVPASQLATRGLRTQPHDRPGAEGPHPARAAQRQARCGTEAVAWGKEGGGTRSPMTG